MERVAGHYDKIVLTIIMCLAILFLATFSPLAESTRAVGVLSGSLLAIIVAALAAVGITFVTTGSFSNSAELVESLIFECADYYGVSVDSMTSGIQSGTNKLGQILINNRFVQFIDTLAKYIRYKYNLVDNSHVTIRPQGMSMGQVTLYNLPVTVMSGNAQEGYTTEMYLGVGYAAFVAANPSNPTSVIMNVVSEVPGTVEEIYIRPNGQVGTAAHRVELAYDSVSGKYLASNYREYQSSGWKNYIINNYTINSTTDYEHYLGYNVLPTEGISINTGVITPPLEDDNYTDGDGAIIDIGAAWGLTYDDVTDDVIPGDYSDSKEGEASIEYAAEDEIAEAVESTSEITNLPAGTIPFTPLQLPQIHLSSIWHYVAQWISDTAIAAGSLMAIVVQNPGPMVNLFYATVCLAIIFGLIKGIAK